MDSIATNSDWLVGPSPAASPSTEECARLRLEARRGLLAPCAIVAGVLWGLIASLRVSWLIALLAAVGVTLLLFLMASANGYRAKLRRLLTEKDEISRQEAMRTTIGLRALLEESEELIERVERRQEHVKVLLTQARQEYSLTAYTPFWDVVEQCAGEFAGIRSDLLTLADRAATYAWTLSNRRHSFPNLRHTVPSSDELKLLRDGFQTVVRQAQRDFQFAVIWEHRKTRDAIAAGFQTLGEAVSGIGAAISGSIDVLSNSLNDGFEKVIAGQQLTRESTSSRLSEIATHTADTAAAAKDVSRVITRYRLLER